MKGVESFTKFPYRTKLGCFACSNGNFVKNRVHLVLNFTAKFSTMAEKKITKKFKMDASTFENNRSKGRKLDLSKGRDIHHEVNLIGMNSDDAVHEMEQYLDQAYMSHLPSVRVVHGKGSGILRQAVQQRLRSIPYVKSFKLGEYGEGDSGVTIVTFK